MSLLKSYTVQNGTTDKEQISDKISRKVANHVEHVQRRFARALNKPVNALTVKRLKRLVLLFIVVFGGYSLHLIIGAVAKFNANQIGMPGAIHRPRYYNKTGDGVSPNNVYVDEATFRQMEMFRTYMDSLKQSSKHSYDSILANRPKLMDSIALLEALYYSQKTDSQK